MGVFTGYPLLLDVRLALGIMHLQINDGLQLIAELRRIAKGWPVDRKWRPGINILNRPWNLPVSM